MGELGILFNKFILNQKEVICVAKQVKAVVQKVIKEGKHGPFAVAQAKEIDGSVTFSLEPTVWQEQEWPQVGEVVLLENLRQKRAGWRAKKARFLNPCDEQKANRKEQRMDIVKALMTRWKSRLFPSEEDQIWQQWVDHKKREWRDLIALLNQEAKDSFKARALYLLFVPDIKMFPFYWSGDTNVFPWSRFPDKSFLQGLSFELLDFVTDLVIKFHEYSKTDEKYEDAWYCYQNYLLELLVLLPEEKAQRVFDQYELRDLYTWQSMDDASGYNPFERLLGNEKINLSWKVLADQKMQEIIKAETEGQHIPRTKWENAFDWYATVWGLNLYSEKFRSDIDFWAQQLEFILAYTGSQTENVFPRHYNVYKIFQILADDKYLKLRFKLALHVVFNSDKEFKVYSQDTLRSAQIMLEQFAERDAELKVKLERAIEIGQSKLAAEAKAARSEKTNEESILAQMR